MLRHVVQRCWQHHHVAGSLASLQRTIDEQIVAAKQEYRRDRPAASALWYPFSSESTASLAHHQQQGFATMPGPPSPPHGISATAPQPDTSGRGTASGDATRDLHKHVIYKGKWITPFRLLVRGKIFQLFGVAGVTMAVAAVVTSEDISAMEAFWLTALGLGAAGGSACLWYYSRRYVGELSLLMPHGRQVRFSTLDFWGNRQDTDVDVERVRAPFKNLSEAAVRKLTRSPLFPVDVEGDRQYYMSVHSAQIFDKQTLMKLLEGTYTPSAPPERTTEQLHNKQ